MLADTTNCSIRMDVNQSHNFQQHQKQNSDNCEEDSSDDEQSVATPLLPSEPSPSKRANKSKSVARTNDAGIGIPLQKELAQDVERVFGNFCCFKRDPFGTSKLCGRKPDTCGDSKSKLRQQVRDKLKHWKKLSTNEHRDALRDLGLWASKQTEDFSTDEAPPVCPLPATNKERHHEAAKTTSQSPPIKIDLQQPKTMNQSSTCTVKVNTEHPETNGEMMIYDLDRIEGVGEKEHQLFKGFWMLMPIDIRHILDDTVTAHWKARMFSSNKVLVSVQAWNCSVLCDRDQFEQRVSSNALESMDAAHHDIVNNEGATKEDRKWKHLFLDFDDDVQLSAKAINANAGEDEKLELQLIPVTVAHPKNASIKHTSMCAGWKVARTDIKARKKGKAEKKETKSDAAKQLDDLLSGVNGVKIEQLHPTQMCRLTSDTKI